MNRTEYLVYWIDNEFDGSGPNAEKFVDGPYPGSAMSAALSFMQKLREPGRGITFISMASENVENVGKMGVGTIVDGKCDDGGDFLGRTARHGMALKRNRE